MNSEPQFFEIFIMFVIAAFLINKLRNLLGASPEDEDSEKNKDTTQSFYVVEEAQPLDSQDADNALEQDIAKDNNIEQVSGLMQIKQSYPSFDTSEFLDGAKFAFEMIVNAFAEGNIPELEPLLGKDVMAKFAEAIEKRKIANETMEWQVIGFEKIEICSAELENHNAKIVVKFVSEQVNIIRDLEGKVISGDPNYIQSVTDIWTFSRDMRSSNPNWLLLSTRSA